jgi:ABC-type glycerol-3-phosphate transport system substrate-binding protein
MYKAPRAALTRRRFLTASAGLAATAAGGGLLSACASSVSGNKANSSSQTLTLMTKANEFDAKAVAAAEQAIGAKIKLVVADVTKLTAMLASNEPPDLVRGSGALDTPYLAARGVVLDLDPYFAKSQLLKVDDLDPVNDVWRFDGQKQGTGPRYGMAKDYSQDAMIWYNTKLFDAAKVAYPSDTTPLGYAEWLELGKKLTKTSGGKTIQYGMNGTGLGLFASLINMVTSAGGRLFSEDLATVDFSSAEAQAALTWYIDYAKANVGPSVVNPNPDGWDWPPYQAGRMAMAQDGYWFGGAIGGDAKVAATSRFAPAPQFGSNRVSPCFGATGYWIPKASKNKDLAWKFFEWYFGGEPAQQRAASGWGIPTLKSLRAKMPQEQPYQKQAYAVQEAELSHFSVLSFTPYLRVEALDAVLNQQLPGAIKGAASVGALADALNAEMNKQLKAGKELVK